MIKLLPYILFEKYINILPFIWKWSAQGTGTVPIVSAHFRFPVAVAGVSSLPVVGTKMALCVGARLTKHKGRPQSKSQATILGSQI